MLVATLSALACSTEAEPPGGADGPRSACSTGPAYEFNASFPSLGDDAPRGPECVARCGVEKELIARTAG